MARRRTLPFVVLVAAFLGLIAAPSGASGATVQVVEVNGPMDGRLIDFAVSSIESSDASLVVLELDATAVLDEGIEDLIDLVAAPPVPVAVWVGPAPAVAHGGAAQLLLSAPIRGAAPEAVIGYAAPTVAGRQDTDTVVERFPDLPEDLIDGRRVVTEPIAAVVDVVSPSIGQFVVGLDGTEVEIDGEIVVLETARTEVEDGVEVVKPLGDVVFDEPGLLTRTLRVTIRPEAAFLFLVIGLALITFELYAAGPGVAAAVGALALFLAGYGLSVLPANWWAVAMAVIGLLLFTADVQRNAPSIAGVAGTGLLLGGGLTLVDGGRQLPISWWAVVLVVAGAALFYGFALTTVARARFSTATIGREHLIGSVGVAVGDFGPEGVVELQGARWKAVARRAADVRAGDALVVVGVDGVVLDVEPTDPGGDHRR